MKNNNLIIFVFIIGLLIFAYPHVAQKVNDYIQKSQVQEFKSSAQSLEDEDIEQQIDLARKCNEAIHKNEGVFQDPFTDNYDPNKYKECAEALDNNILEQANNGDESQSLPDGKQFASIEIPKLSLEIPIYLGASENELSRGIGQVDGSSLPIGGLSTHTVLAGHRGMGTKAMFRNLDVLKPGDTFYIYTMQEKLKYTVSDVDVILPHETDNLRIVEGEDLASLITCHPYRANSHRLVVYGTRAK